MKDDSSESEMARRLARAEAAVADLAKSYVGWASADVENCGAHLAAARAGEGAARLDAIQALHSVAHNIKGQGSSFGFPLMTRIGNSLCRLTRNRRAAGDADLTAIQAHLDAMGLVLAQGIRGDGGPLGEKLAQRLEAMAAEILGPDAAPGEDLIR